MKNLKIITSLFLIIIVCAYITLFYLIVNYIPGRIAASVIGLLIIYFILSQKEKHIKLKNKLSLLSPVFITSFLFILSTGIMFKAQKKDIISDYLIVILGFLTLIITLLIFYTIYRYFYRTRGKEKTKVLIYKTIYQVIAYGLTIYSLIQQISMSIPYSSDVYLINKYIFLLSSYSGLISISFFESYYKNKE